MRLVVGVAIVRGQRVLAARRTGGGWEFPGGKVEHGETPEEAVVREIAEELGCVVEVRDWLDAVQPINAELELRVALAELVGGEPAANQHDHDELRWLAADELGDVDWLPADVVFVAGLTAKGVLVAD